MSIELRIPEVGESVTEAHIARWLKDEGQHVEKDEAVVELETDKATLELPAPAAGTVTGPLKKAGDAAKIGEVIGHIQEDGATPARGEPAATSGQSKPAASAASEGEAAGEPGQSEATQSPQNDAPSPGTPSAKSEIPNPKSEIFPTPGLSDDREEEIVPMTPMRRRIAQRLVQAQQNAALLTTFNEVDMSAVGAFRQRFQEAFQARYKIKLGLMSFFVKAAIDALKHFPALNAQISGTNIVYRNYYDIGIAISTDRGLVVPVLRNAQRMSFAEVELAIADLAARARDNRIRLEELQGGTFTITNGGVFGSLLSTPIVNPPQSGVMGMHTIQERPVARQGQVVIRPMMYLALTYDHRIIDGREAIGFLSRVMAAIEEPARMLIEV